MGNSLPKNPTYKHYTKYFSKLIYPDNIITVNRYILQAKLDKRWRDVIFFSGESLKYAYLNYADIINDIIHISSLVDGNILDILIPMIEYAKKNIGDQKHVVKLITFIGDTYLKNGDNDHALEFYEKSRDIYSKFVLSPDDMVKIRTKLANIYNSRHQYTTAFTLLEENVDDCNEKLFDKNNPLSNRGLCRMLNKEDIKIIFDPDIRDDERFEMLLSTFNKYI